MTTTITPPAYQQTSRPRGLRGVLFALSPATRPIRSNLPPPGVVGRFDPQLAAEISNITRADAEAEELALAWAATEPGGAVFNQVLDEEHRLIAADTRTPDNSGPLYRLLTVDGPAAFAKAYRAQARADYYDAELRRHAVANKKLKTTLEEAATAIEAEMEKLYARTQSKKDRVRFLEAEEQAARYAEVWSLLRWLHNTAEPYEKYNALIPHALVVAEYEAAMRLGEKRMLVPDELLPQAGGEDDPTWTGIRPRR